MTQDNEKQATETMIRALFHGVIGGPDALETLIADIMRESDGTLDGARALLARYADPARTYPLQAFVERCLPRLSQTEWRQVDGDGRASVYGAIFARLDPFDIDMVEMVKIDHWIDHWTDCWIGILGESDFTRDHPRHNQDDIYVSSYGSIEWRKVIRDGQVDSDEPLETLSPIDLALAYEEYYGIDMDDMHAYHTLGDAMRADDIPSSALWLTQEYTAPPLRFGDDCPICKTPLYPIREHTRDHMAYLLSTITIPDDISITDPMMKIMAALLLICEIKTITGKLHWITVGTGYYKDTLRIFPADITASDGLDVDYYDIASSYWQSCGLDGEGHDRLEIMARLRYDQLVATLIRMVADQVWGTPQA